MECSGAEVPLGIKVPDCNVDVCTLLIAIDKPGLRLPEVDQSVHPMPRPMPRRSAIRNAMRAFAGNLVSMQFNLGVFPDGVMRCNTEGFECFADDTVRQITT